VSIHLLEQFKQFPAQAEFDTHEKRRIATGGAKAAPPQKQVPTSTQQWPKERSAVHVFGDVYLLRVCPETSRGIAKFSEHEAD
jgi:hypothetical protein